VVRHNNLKATIIRACPYDTDIREMYTAFARYWGFVPLPSRPHHSQEQGIAERSSNKASAVNRMVYDSRRSRRGLSSGSERGRA